MRVWPMLVDSTGPAKFCGSWTEFTMVIVVGLARVTYEVLVLSAIPTTRHARCVCLNDGVRSPCASVEEFGRAHTNHPDDYMIASWCGSNISWRLHSWSWSRSSESGLHCLGSASRDAEKQQTFLGMTCSRFGARADAEDVVTWAGDIPST